MKKIMLAITLLSTLTLVSCKEAEGYNGTITIAGAISELGVDKTYTLVSFLSEDTDETVTWSSSNEDIATVDSNGTVTGVSIGDVTITASIGDVSASYDLTVVHNFDKVIEELSGDLALKSTVYINDEYYSDVTLYSTTDRYYVEMDSIEGYEEYMYYTDEDGLIYSSYIYYDNEAYNYGPIQYIEDYIDDKLSYFDEHFYNPFTEYELHSSYFSENSDGSYTLTYPLNVGEEDSFVFGMLTGYLGYSTSIDVTLNNDSTLKSMEIDGYYYYSYSTTSYDIRAEIEVLDASEINPYITPYETTEESTKLQNFFNSVNELNYTATVTDSADSSGEYVMKVDEDTLYYSVPSEGEYLYLDTEDGLDITSVDNTALTLTGIADSVDPYKTVSEYIPTINFAAEIFEVQEDGSYVLRTANSFYDYVEHFCIDQWFFDYYEDIVDGTLRIVLSDDGTSATITYDYESYVFYDTYYDVFEGTVTTVISNVGNTINDFSAYIYTASVEYTAPTKWSEYSQELWDNCYLMCGFDLDEIPFIDINQYHATGCLMGFDDTYWQNQITFDATDEGRNYRASAMSDYVDYIVGLGWTYNDESGFYDDPNGKYELELTTLDVSGYYCWNLYIYY